MKELWSKQHQKNKGRIDPKNPDALEDFCAILKTSLWQQRMQSSQLVILCIGTDLVIGDSLGPLVGHQLKQQLPCHIPVYGTLEDPLHAVNLAGRLEEIKRKHPSACFLAVDASVGSKNHIGTVCIQPCPLFPGSGVSKSLPPVGQICITGIVCSKGPGCHKRLQQTPLSILIPQVDLITQGLYDLCVQSPVYTNAFTFS